MKQVALFGEVLFDLFPDGEKVLGGAPFNVAWHLQAFGLRPLLLSAVGQDIEATEIIDAMTRWGLQTSGLAKKDSLATGRVAVSLQAGEPSYEIVHPVAFDAIDISPELLKPYDLLYAGSLALRNEVSRQTFHHLLAHEHGKVFIDINLREPWWQLETLEWLLNKANWVKLNHHEMAYLNTNLTPAIELNPEAFKQHYQLEGLIVTHGSKGAELICSEGHYKVLPEMNIEVIDAVGAGDAFASVIIAGLVNQWSMNVALERAQAFASAVVSNRGATISDRDFYQNILSQWSDNNPIIN